jgi:hypothetical protein
MKGKKVEAEEELAEAQRLDPRLKPPAPGTRSTPPRPAEAHAQ